MTNLISFGYVLLGGALGALARFLCGLWIGQWLAETQAAPYPWATTFVNLVGSFLFGFLWASWEGNGGMPLPWRLFLLSGVLGAFTTFSTFMFESLSLLTAGKPVLAFLNLFTQNALGLLCVFAGVQLGR